MDDKKFIIKLLLITLLIVAGIILFRTCNPVVQPPDRTPEIDSLVRVVETISEQEKSYRDSATRVVAVLEDSVKVLKHQLRLTQQSLTSTKTEAKTFQKVIADARVRKDTISHLEACDSLSILHDAYVIQAEKSFNEALQVIDVQDEIISVKDSVIGKQVSFMSAMRTAFDSSTVISRELNTDLQKAQNKLIQQRSISRGLLFALAIATTILIIK